MRPEISLGFTAIKYESYILAFKLKLIAGNYFNSADVSFSILPGKCIYLYELAFIFIIIKDSLSIFV